MRVLRLLVGVCLLLFGCVEARSATYSWSGDASSVSGQSLGTFRAVTSSVDCVEVGRAVASVISSGAGSPKYELMDCGGSRLYGPTAGAWIYLLSAGHGGGYVFVSAVPDMSYGTDSGILDGVDNVPSSHLLALLVALLMFPLGFLSAK